MTGFSVDVDDEDIELEDMATQEDDSLIPQVPPPAIVTTTACNAHIT